MFSCNKRTVGLLSCSKPTVLRLHSRSSTVQQTYRFPPRPLTVQQTYRFPPRPLTVQQTYRFPPGLLPCSEPTATYRFPPGLLPCSEPTAFPPASYRAANLPFLPHALNLPGSNRSKKPPFGGLGIYGVTTDVPLPVLASGAPSLHRVLDSICPG